MTSQSTDTVPISCSMLSMASGEQLFATAPRTDVWLLVEYRFPPSEKGLVDSSISEAVIKYLLQCQKTIPGCRLLLVRPAEKPRTDLLKVFIGVANQQPPRLYELNIHSYHELIDLDIPALVGHLDQTTTQERKEPLFLICTNGKRDPCCAQWGPLVLKAATQFAGDSVWQTSHVGGHRFAANQICLPHGIYYGRVRPDRVQAIITGYQQNQFTMDHYRGRAIYNPEAQAAEYFLNIQTAVFDIDAYHLLETQQSSDTSWMVTFDSKLDGSRYTVQVTAKLSDFSIYESCSTPKKRSQRLQYQLEGWRKT